MKQFDKKIAFAISSQHFIAHGGVGQYCKAFCDMAKDFNWAVHIILDRPPQNTPLLDYIGEQEHVKIILPENVTPVGGHSKTYVFTDSMHLERMLNFRNSLTTAFQDNIYDLISINSPDAVTPIYNMDLHKFIPVIFYTHSEIYFFTDEVRNKTFTDSTVNYMQNFLNLKGLTVATQSQRNVDRLKDKGIESTLLPMTIPEQSLIAKKNTKFLKSGIMFVGRWEKLKAPEEFCDACIAADLPAKILTNKKGAPKFAKYFDDRNFSKYEIKAGVIGKEKVDFLQSAKIAFHPSKIETYGFSAFETLHTSDTLFLEENDWYKNFDDIGYGVIVVNGQELVDKLKSIYYNSDNSNSDERYLTMLEKHNNTLDIWRNFMPTEFSGQSTRDNVFINSVDKTISLREFIYGKLNRTYGAIDDLVSVYSKLNNVQVTQTIDETFFTKQGVEVETPTNLEDLFV